ncbi:tyrosinase family protein [Sphingomonas aerolata]|uniref:DUF7868 domain-containing protein n=1 Tax=Sphingomonas aerolata TaxID=185951 RepID=UPI003A5BD63A
MPTSDLVLPPLAPRVPGRVRERRRGRREGARGPQDWALPYWDYSADDPARLMPPEFCTEKIGGADNPLWVQWGRTADGDMAFNDQDVSLACLDSEFFAGTSSGGENGFAGPVSAFMHFGGLVGLPNGKIEEGPHNAIHSQIGGLMGDPRYAALDPIFWLHHSNIDRLWERWRTMHPDLADPGDVRWRSTVGFDLHGADGEVWRFKPEDLLETALILHGYTYDDMAVSGTVTLGGLDVPEIAPEDATFAGASGAVDIVDGVGGGRLRVGTDDVSLSIIDAPPRVYLNLENIVGAGEDANFQIFARDVSGTGEETMVGQVSMFGLEAASDRKSVHGGAGLNKVIEITPFAQRLNLTSAGETELDVSFRRRERLTEKPEFMKRGGKAKVSIGRISVFYAPGKPA